MKDGQWKAEAVTRRMKDLEALEMMKRLEAERRSDLKTTLVEKKCIKTYIASTKNVRIRDISEHIESKDFASNKN